MIKNKLIRVVDIAPVIDILPDPSIVKVPAYPANAVWTTEKRLSVDETTLRKYCLDKHTEFKSPKPLKVKVESLPDNYCTELLNHVRYYHPRSDKHLPVYLGETLCTAAQALPDLILAANMCRSIFTHSVATIDRSEEAEARNWLLLARQLEYVANVIMSKDPEPRIVITKSVSVWGNPTDDFSEEDETFYLDSALLTASGLSAEEALAQFELTTDV